LFPLDRVHLFDTNVQFEGEQPPVRRFTVASLLHCFTASHTVY
jgi:hypothetical protein